MYLSLHNHIIVKFAFSSYLRRCVLQSQCIYLLTIISLLKSLFSVIFGDVYRPTGTNMTVAWSTYAQSLTNKPMKGMLTGPVTMLCWSFVRDDQPRSTTALQIALALRDEVVDLQNNGISVIQIDEPAFRSILLLFFFFSFLQIFFSFSIPLSFFPPFFIANHCFLSFFIFLFYIIL